MKGRTAVTVLLALSCLLNTSCSSLGVNNIISRMQAMDFVFTVAGSAASALSTAAAAQGVQSRSLEALPARILKGTLARNPKVKAQQMHVQCNAARTSCTFSDNFNISDSCQTGGTMTVAGSVNGTWHHEFRRPVAAN